jgi:hypothetical protein
MLYYVKGSSKDLSTMQLDLMSSFVPKAPQPVQNVGPLSGENS